MKKLIIVLTIPVIGILLYLVLNVRDDNKRLLSYCRENNIHVIQSRFDKKDHLIEVTLEGKSIENLNLSEYLDLKKVELTRFPKLKTIDLEKCNITHLKLSRLPQLIELNVKDNKNFSQVNLRYLLKLKKIDLEKCNVTQIKLSRLPGLVELNLKNNKKLSHIDLRGLPKLDHLNLENCNITHLKLSDLPELTRFNIQNNNKLTSVNLRRLSRFSNLDLQKYNVTNLKLLKLPQIETLKLNNTLTHLNLNHLKKLVKLDISKSSITNLRLANLPDLVEVNLKENNKLRQVSLRYFPKLKKINLEKCHISQLILSNLPELTELNLKGNNTLTQVNIRSFPKLSKIDLEECNITSLRLSRLPALTELNLNANKQLSSTAFRRVAKLEQLEKLDLQECNISRLKLPVFPKLKELNLSGNKNLSSLKLKSYPSLEILNITDSNVRELKLSDLPELKELDVSNNIKLTRLDLTNLVSLNKLVYDLFNSRIEEILFHRSNQVYPGVSKVKYDRDEKGKLYSEEYFDRHNKYINRRDTKYARITYTYIGDKREVEEKWDYEKAERVKDDAGENYHLLSQFNLVQTVNKVYPSQMNDEKKPIIGILRIKNSLKEKIHLNIKLSSKAFKPFFGSSVLSIGQKVTLNPSDKMELRIFLPFSEKLWENTRDQFIKSTVEIDGRTEKSKNRFRKRIKNLNFTLMSRNKIKWDDIRNIAPFGSVDDPVIKELAKTVENLNSDKNFQVPLVIYRMLAAYEILRTFKLNYSSMSRGSKEDIVKSPSEILADKTGKCTDTSIIYGSLLQKLGYSVIVTTFTYKHGAEKISHIMLLIDTGVKAKDWRFLHKDKNKLVILGEDSHCYIPIETTAFTTGFGSENSDFLRAWNKGIVQFYKHKNQIFNPENTFRLGTAWNTGFKSMQLMNLKKFTIPSSTVATAKPFIKELQNNYIVHYLNSEREYSDLNKKLDNNNFESVFKLANYLSTVRRYSESQAYFQNAIKLATDNPVPHYYYTAVLVYMALSGDPTISIVQKESAKKNFAKVAETLSQLLIHQKVQLDSEKEWSMNYDLAKWFNIFGNRNKANIHDRLAKNAQQKIKKQEKVTYSEELKEKLTAKGFSEGFIRMLQNKKIGGKAVIQLVEQKVDNIKELETYLLKLLSKNYGDSILNRLLVNKMSMKALTKLTIKKYIKNEKNEFAIKGFSEENVLSQATKGYSEDDVLSIASKGFAENDVLAIATKGFSEGDILSVASKGRTEEAWSMTN
ncbi:MAG: hypothetical protein IEMM0008_0189 [bacterium]|nr:MAG: hypothetical protein IEMM0008_0189 [bacterium]